MAMRLVMRDAYVDAHGLRARLRPGELDCRDCQLGTRSELYMVHEALWAKAGASPDDILCVGCLERRLRRELDARDFTGAPINTAPAYRSRRLIDRLARRANP